MDYGIAILSRVIDLIIFGNDDAREAIAMRECPFLNLCYRWWDGDAREAGATRESSVPNLCHRWGDGSIFTSTYQCITLRMDYGIAVLSGVIYLVVRRNGEALATRESPSPNLRHRWWNGDARETGAITESTAPNLRQR